MRNILIIGICSLLCSIIYILFSNSFALSHKQNKPSEIAVQREIAITFDDLPGAESQDLQRLTEMSKRLIKTIVDNKIPAIGFVNESKLFVDKEFESRKAFLKMWLDNGLDLGNHTYSHAYIDETPLDKYKNEIIKGEVITKELLKEKGRNIKYFRHTQLRTGPTIEYKRSLEKFLVEHGYTVAPVTIDNNEYIFAVIYNRAKLRGDTATMKRVADAYITYMEEMFEFFEKLSRDSMGYEIKQILLLHANELNSDYFDELVSMIKRRNYKFISLDDALTDKAYRQPDAQTDKGISWIHRWMIEKGDKIRPEPSEPKFIRELLNSYR
jgi:peptidoglycan-N-acetylglucosamine deacetylase